MTPIRVLLVCGSGASSGFMATSIRKAAAARGVELTITARGEAEIEDYVDRIDVLMVGPHLAYVLNDVDEYVGNAPVKVILMRADYYSTLDGERGLDHLLTELGQTL